MSAGSRRVFVRAGAPVGVIGGTDERYRRKDGALVVLPDERWGNPLFADGCLDEADFHIHARLTVEQLAGTGASALLGGHYHYSHSRPEGNHTFRISLDEDICPANKTLAKDMWIVHGMANPLKKHWNLEENLPAKAVVGRSRAHIRPGEPFAVDIVRRGPEVGLTINGREVFRARLDDASRIPPGRCGDTGWPIIVGWLPGHAPLRIHDWWAEGRFTGPVWPACDVWRLNADGYINCRMPAICRTPDGQLLAFSEARHARPSRSWEWEDALVKDEIHAVMKRSGDNGRTWSEQTLLIDRGVSYEPRDASPVVDAETGEVFLFTGPGPWVIASRDAGRTWSEPRALAEAGPGEIRDFHGGAGNSAIQLRYGPHRGRLLAALYQKNVVGLVVSDDHGKTWQPGAMAAFSGACEPSLVELSDGRVVVSPRIGPRVGPPPRGRLFLTSADGGGTFAGTRYEPAIPIPGQGELVAVDLPGAGATQARRALVFCGAAEHKTRLTLMASLDDGKTWPTSTVLDDGPAANLALVALPEGQVGVLYETDKYLRQRFMRVDLAELIRA